MGATDLDIFENNPLEVMQFVVDPTSFDPSNELDQEGGIRNVIAAYQPAGVPEENWLPITRKDEAIDVILRMYLPDLERFSSCSPPQARRLGKEG